jgi:tetratricopeptide (TPR) repeat protein
MATSLKNVGLLYRDQGKYEEAEPLLLRALKIHEEQLGENHPDIATSLNNLGLIYQKQEKYEKAECLFLRSLKIFKEQLGENHPNMATSLNNVGLLYRDQGKYEEAEPLLLRALKIFEEQLGENHLNTYNFLNSVAFFYQEQNRYSDAIPLLERWKNIKKKLHETRNTEYADRICTLGKLYEKCRQFPEALANYEEALSIFKLVLDSKLPRIRVLQAELNRLKNTIKKSKRKS